INLRKYRKKIHIAADSVQLDSTSRIAVAHDAIVAINGGVFDMQNGGSVDVVKVDGEVINHTRTQSDRADAVLLIANRKTAIEPASAVDYEHGNLPNVLLSGPLLIKDGIATKLPATPFNNNRHPRSAIATTAN